MFRCRRTCIEEDGWYVFTALLSSLVSTCRKLALLTSLLPGIKSYTVSLDDQTAEVITNDDSLSYETVLEKIAKTGKKVNSGEADGVVKSV